VKVVELQRKERELGLVLTDDTKQTHLLLNPQHSCRRIQRGRPVVCSGASSRCLAMSLQGSNELLLFVGVEILELFVVFDSLPNFLKTMLGSLWETWSLCSVKWKRGKQL
jgi:hypothetical protein